MTSSDTQQAISRITLAAQGVGGPPVNGDPISVSKSDLLALLNYHGEVVDMLMDLKGNLERLDISSKAEVLAEREAAMQASQPQ